MTATSARRVVRRRNTIRASWTFIERNVRAQVARARQRELLTLPGLLPLGKMQLARQPVVSVSDAWHVNRELIR
jgi:hypothetical protein